MLIHDPARLPWIDGMIWTNITQNEMKSMKTYWPVRSVHVYALCKEVLDMQLNEVIKEVGMTKRAVK